MRWTPTLALSCKVLSEIIRRQEVNRYKSCGMGVEMVGCERFQGDCAIFWAFDGFSTFLLKLNVNYDGQQQRFILYDPKRPKQTPFPGTRKLQQPSFSFFFPLSYRRNRKKLYNYCTLHSNSV